MDELEATTLAMMAANFAGETSSTTSANAAATATAITTQTPTTIINDLLLNQNNNSTFISEDDELKLLNFPSKQEDLSTAIPLTVIFALLLVTGCIGNLCTAIVIARPKNKYMHTATNYYLFSLAMSDFLFLILGLPQEMYTLWQRYPYAFGESFCIIRGYLSEASTYASILTISAFTIERYVAICHPLWAHTMSQLPRAITSIVIIWILSAICAIPPAAELGIVTLKGPVTNRTLEQSAQCATKRTIYENMFVVSAIVFFIVPMIIVTVLYILIAIELRRSSKMNNAISKQTSSSQQHQLSSKLHHHNHHNHHHHHHHHNHYHPHHHHHSHHNHTHLQHQNSLASTNLNQQHHNYHQNQNQNQNKQQHQHQYQYQHDQENRNCLAGKFTHNSSDPLCDSKTHLPLALAHSGEGFQQRFTCTISPNSELTINKLEVEEGQVDLLGESEQTITMLDNNNKCTGSLMADIMSQRPSSAIGTERRPSGNLAPMEASLGEQASGSSDNKKGGQVLSSLLGGLAGSLARLQPSLGKSHLWPLFWSNQSKRQRQRQQQPPPVSVCHCYLSQNLAQRPHLQHSMSQQCASPSTNILALNDSVESIMVAASQHSPLSYHESLIQHRSSNNGLLKPNGGGQPHHLSPSAAAAAAAAGVDAGAGAGGVHKRQLHQQAKLLNHQFSLCNSPTYLSNSTVTAAPPLSVHSGAGGNHLHLHLHQQRHHNHHHHNHHRHHHQQAHSCTPNQSRRSAAASSKKSVIRMLVAVVVSFFICWVPFHAQRLLASYLAKAENQNQVLLEIFLKLTYISGVMYYLSSTINPLLYQLMSAKFRLAFKETFRCSLFRCAILIRSSAGAATNGNSPTNSLKETHLHQHLRGRQGSGACGYYCSQTSQSSQHVRGQLTHLDSKLSATSALDVKDSGICCCGGGSGGGCCCCCCYCFGNNNSGAEDDNHQLTQSAIWEPYGSQVAAAGHLGGSVMSRLRGRLNTSLSSLFRTSSQNADYTCPCCAFNQPVTSSSAKARARFAHNSTNNYNKGRTGSGSAGEQDGNAAKHSTSCASTPLLMGQQQQQQQQVAAAPGSGSVSPSNFSARSMLKFIRSPTPMQFNQTSLTRLSSREEPTATDEPTVLANAEGPDNNAADLTDHLAACSSPPDGMDLLIKATIDNQVDEGQADHEQQTSLATTSAESGNSTAGSSPDQHLLTRSALCQQGERRRAPASISKSSVAACQFNRKQPRHKLSSWSSNGSTTVQQEQQEHLLDGKQHRHSSRKRRSSYQPTHLSNYLGQAEPPSAINQRRESSSSSNTNTNNNNNSNNNNNNNNSDNHRHLSSSLSSSERHLDKKSSISTTTSAIDCGSYTTTNSQMTANGLNCGSNPSQTDWTM